MPYRAPGVDDPRQSWILREVNQAQKTLDESIAEAASLPSSDLTRSKRIARYNALKRELGGTFNSLDKSVRVWAERDVPSLYQAGWFVGAGQTGANFDFTLPHREALEVLSYDAYDDVATRLMMIEQGFSDTIDMQKLYEGLSLEDMVAIQSRTRSSVAQALLTGNADQKKVARGLAQDLWRDNPSLQIVDSGGRQWKMETYTRMLVRTKSANAYNAGSLNKFAEEGVKRVQVFDGVQDDEECAEANGDVWTLRYAMSNVIQHPNCRRAFAPVSGAGNVDRDTDLRKGAVAFDRVELSVTALAALRHFRQTGEINVSSTLARIVIEIVESATIPLPVIDGFIMGLASQGFQSFDRYIESFVDPILYHAGLLKNVPKRALIVKASRPQTVLDEVADMVRRASQEAFGSETVPKVQSLLDTIVGASVAVDKGVGTLRRATRTNHQGGLGWLSWVVDSVIEPTELGMLTSDVLLRMRDGTADDLISAYVAAAETITSLKRTRLLHISAMNASLREAQEAYLELDRIINHASALLAGDNLKRVERDRRAATAARAAARGAADEGEGLARRYTEEALQRTSWSRTNSSGVGDGLGAQLAVTPIARYDLLPSAAARLEEIGGSLLPMYELPVGKEGARVFHDAVAQARSTLKFGTSVTVYDVSEYSANHRLFLTGDGTAGFALTADGQLISVFNMSTTAKKPLFTMVPLAIAEGATRADAFDTVLPKLYAQFGLHPVTRLRFVDEFAPDGWSYKLYSSFNDGRPDVVFLRYDPDLVGAPYTRGAGAYVDDYDVGLASTLPVLAGDEDVPQWFIDGIRKYGLTLQDQQDISTAQRQLVYLIQEASQGQGDLLVRINALQDVRPDLSARKLAFPAVPTPHIPSSAPSFWDLDDLDSFTGDLRRALEATDIGASVNLKPFEDFRTVILLGSKDPAVRAKMVDNMRPYRPNQTLIDFVETHLGMVNVDWTDKEDVFDVLLELLSRLQVSADTGLIQIRSAAGRVVPMLVHDDLNAIGNAIYLLHERFWSENAKLVLDLIKKSPNSDLILRNLAHGSKIQFGTGGAVPPAAEQAMKALWARVIGSFASMAGDINEPNVSFRNLMAVVEQVFDAGSVSTLSPGIHGMVLLVDSDVGKFVVKPLQSTGHTGGNELSVASMIINSWIADILGSDVVPYRVFAINDDELVVVSPFMSDMREAYGWGINAADLPSDAVRRLSLFHYITMEADANPRNFMYSPDYTTLVRIDHESAFGLLDGGGAPVLAPYGINNMPGAFMEKMLKEKWAAGLDESFGTEPAARLYQLTEDEIAYYAYTDIAGLRSRDAADVRINLTKKSSLPIMHIGGPDDELFIATGRIARLEWTDFDGTNEMWSFSHSVTDVELEFLERLIREPEDVLDEIKQELIDALTDVPESIIADQVIDVIADEIILSLEVRANQLVELGFINLSAGVTEVTNQYGKVFRYGETIEITRAIGKPFPNEPAVLSGLVINLFESLDGTKRAGVLRNIGIGKSADELAVEGVEYVIVNIDQYADIDTIPVLSVKRNLEKSVYWGGELPSPIGVSEVYLDPLDRFAVTLDDLGLAIGPERGAVQIEIRAKPTDMIRFVDEQGAVADLNVTAMHANQAVDILQEELSKVRPEYRPKKIVVHAGMIETEDGKKTLGFFDPDSHVMHVSLAAVHPVGSRSATGTSIAGTRGAINAVDGVRLPEGMLVPAQRSGAGSLVDQLNWDGFREVARHEVSHSVHVGVEDIRRIRVRNSVVQEILDTSPDAVLVRDLEEIALALLPEGIVVGEGESALRALIAYRSAILEDITNTNLAHHAETLLDLATQDGGLLPSWANRAYMDIRRRDPDAHHELFAEIWARIAAKGGTDAAVKEIADELGISIKGLLIFIDPDDVPIPPSWNMLSDEFAIWMSTVLNPNAKIIIPLRGSRSRRLWEQGGYLRDLRKRVFDVVDDPGEGRFAYNAASGGHEESGVIVSILESQETISADTEAQLAVLWDAAYSAFEKKHQAALRSEDVSIGVWKTFNQQTQKWEIKLSTVRVFDDDLDAAQFGFSQGQRTMFDLDTGEVIHLLDEHADFEAFLDAKYRGRIPYSELIGRTERIAALKEKRKVKGVDVFTDIEYVKGRKRAPVTMSVFSDKDVARIKKLAETRYNIKITEELMRTNVLRVIDEGLSRFTPAELRERYKFYEYWHDGFVSIAQELDKNPVRLMAAAAVISPKRDAVNNYTVAAILAELIWRDGVIGEELLHDIKLSLRYKERQYIGFGKPEVAMKFRAALDRITASSRPSDFDSDVLGYVLNEIIKARLSSYVPYTGIVGDGMPILARDGVTRTKLGLINQQDYADTGLRAIQLLRGEVSVDQGLSGAKVRPFLNNQIDPFDVYGNRDITIDFHMANLMIWALGSGTAGVDSYGKVAGIDIGLKGMMGDTLRVLFDEELKDRLGIVSDAQLQEILWGLWRDGLREGWWDDVGTVVIKKKKK